MYCHVLRQFSFLIFNIVAVRKIRGICIVQCRRSKETGGDDL